MSILTWKDTDAFKWNDSTRTEFEWNSGMTPITGLMLIALSELYPDITFTQEPD